MVISGFHALRQVRASVAGLEPVTDGFSQIAGQIRYPLYHRRPPNMKELCHRFESGEDIVFTTKEAIRKLRKDSYVTALDTWFRKNSIYFVEQSIG
ncbi:glucose dehydrogenase [acceptor] [Plakobranchus ocellatus]|uniref:Glucose dehydrogenase [acceptor] n=1 Tax=Plakobranchus ocellatus TaxID=259542 RepID=A0AAV3ZPR6_9GAST|nr:glucose dehydrogenase [acceptor] [Plakobranchus ocellatus]